MLNLSGPTVDAIAMAADGIGGVVDARVVKGPKLMGLPRVVPSWLTGMRTNCKRTAIILLRTTHDASWQEGPE